MRKRGPAILLVVLTIVLVFILGVRYGQQVEKTNKNVSTLLSITPTKPQPTQASLTFKTYSGKACGAQFLYPSTLNVIKESSTSVQLAEKETVRVDLTCVASPSAVAKGKKLEIKLNPQTGRTIYFSISEDLLPLFNTSLKFILPPVSTLAPTSTK